MKTGSWPKRVIIKVIRSSFIETKAFEDASDSCSSSSFESVFAASSLSFQDCFNKAIKAVLLSPLKTYFFFDLADDLVDVVVWARAGA